MQKHFNYSVRNIIPSFEIQVNSRNESLIYPAHIVYSLHNFAAL